VRTVRALGIAMIKLNPSTNASETTTSDLATVPFFGGNNVAKPVPAVKTGVRAGMEQAIKAGRESNIKQVA
jgi:hypothetical protein